MKSLKVGDRAPAFTALTDSGAKVSLKDYKGKRVILYFYPKDMTPGCTQEACDFRDAFSKFKKKNIIILAVSKDSAERHEKFRDKYGLPFPLLVDEEGALCEAYGVWKEKMLYGRKFMGIVRSTFVIGETGKIESIFSKVKVKDHIADLLAICTD